METTPPREWVLWLKDRISLIVYGYVNVPGLLVQGPLQCKNETLKPQQLIGFPGYRVLKKAESSLLRPKLSSSHIPFHRL